LGEAVQRDGWHQAGKAIAHDPAQFGELRGKTGWFASAAAKEERAGAERASRAVPDSLRRIHEATEAARRSYVQEVQTQQNRDATEISGLSKAALTGLRDTREDRFMGEIQREGESYDARARRREEDGCRRVAEGSRRSAHSRRAGPVHDRRRATAWGGGRAGGATRRQ
jgi:hypothetical protein